MTSAQALQRAEKSQNLKVFSLADSPWYYVESEEGKICYKVSFVSETEFFCNCADARGNWIRNWCRIFNCAINGKKEQKKPARSASSSEKLM